MANTSRLWIIGVSLSFSFLYFLRVYRQLLYPAYNWYFEYEVPRLEILTTLFCSLLAFVIVCSLLLVIRAQAEGPLKTSLQLLFIALGLLAFGPLSAELLTWWFVGSQESFKYWLPLLVFLGCVLLTTGSDGRVSRITNKLGKVLMLPLPVAALTFAYALALASGSVNTELEPNTIEATLNSPRPKSDLHRVVWVVFDELDFTAMSQRPANIRMPVYEELAASSFVAENAFPPHFWTTVSFPALLSGRQVDWVEPYAADKIILHFRNDEPAPLADTETIFDDVLSLKGRAAVAGWYHPYPRLFRSKLAMGYWTPGSNYRCRSVRDCFLAALANSFEDTPVLKDSLVENPFESSSRIPQIRNRFVPDEREHSEYNLSLREHAKSLVADEALDFVFLHFPTPHAPYLNRRNERANTYPEAFESVDETLSILRDAMKTHNLWERTTVIISSDHWMRSDWDTPLHAKTEFALLDTRIPFLVKPAGDGKAIHYSKRFNTVITRYLVQSILTGEVATSEDVARWLDKVAKERPELLNFHPCQEGENSISLDRYSSSGGPLTCK